MSNVKEEVVNELHKPARRMFKRRRVIVKGIHDLFQSDLVEMQPYSKFNKGYRYILVVINVFSKYVWALPIKTKTSKHVSEAMKKILLNETPPKNMQTDRGGEFYGVAFQKLMKEFKINHYSSFSNMKASVVERVNRTLKSRLFKKFSLQGHYKWLTILPETVIEYNNTVHSVIGMKPIDVNEKNEKEILLNVYSPIKIAHKSKLKVGDSVRISKYRELFFKGYTPNWSNEVFNIKKVNRTNPVTYMLQDQKLEEIQGAFYKEELQKAKHSDVYLIEKVLRRSGNKVYVKWLGLDKLHNSWILKSELV